MLITKVAMLWFDKSYNYICCRHIEMKPQIQCSIYVCIYVCMYVCIYVCMYCYVYVCRYIEKLKILM